MGHLHRKKCAHSIEAAKLQKEVDEELVLNRPFKGKSSRSSLVLILVKGDDQRL